MIAPSVDAGSDVSAVASNLPLIQSRIAHACTRAGHDPAAVSIMAVTKTVSALRIEAAVAAGIRLLGENRVQEAAEKISLVGRREGVDWHFIGHLQTNKAREALRLFSTIQSVDSLRLARHLGRLAGEASRVVPVLLEVNISGEDSKHGFTPLDVREAIGHVEALSGLRVEGLMTIAAQAAGTEVRRAFSGLRELRDRLSSHAQTGLPTLSMGMSDDFEIAVEEGATLIRLGRALFGPRAREE